MLIILFVGILLSRLARLTRAILIRNSKILCQQNCSFLAANSAKPGNEVDYVPGSTAAKAASCWVFYLHGTGNGTFRFAPPGCRTAPQPAGWSQTAWRLQRYSIGNALLSVRFPVFSAASRRSGAPAHAAPHRCCNELPRAFSRRHGAAKAPSECPCIPAPTVRALCAMR